MKNYLAFLFCSLLMAGTVFGQASNCLQGDYPFTGNTNDISSNGYNGTASGGPVLTTDRFGNPGEAYSFDGVDDKIEVSHDFDYPTKTVVVWFNAAQITSTPGFIFSIDHAGLSNPSNVFFTQQINGVNTLTYASGITTANNFSVPINTNQWYMASMVVENGRVEYYLDCNLVHTDTSNGSSSTSGSQLTRFGCSRLNDRFFNGMIDDIKIYDCGLDSIDICNLAVTNPNGCALVSDFPLDGNGIDQGPLQNNGTMYGNLNPTTDRYGNPASATDFDGAGDYIGIPNDYDYPERTISVWFKADTFTTQPAFIFSIDHAGLNNPSGVMFTRLVNGQPSITYASGITTTNNFDQALQDPYGWHMASIVMSATEVKYYLDCGLVNTYTLYPGSSTSGVNGSTIGCSRLIDRFFDGAIDELKIWDCALSSIEIEELCMAPLSAAEAQGLEASWSVYPNPTADIIRVEGNELQEPVSVFSMNGQTVAKGKVGVDISLGHLPSGIYFVKYMSDVKKVIVR